MEVVQEVRQLDDTHVHWVADIGGKRKAWDAQIIEQLPDERIAWRSVEGIGNSGVVEFRPIGPEATELRLHISGSETWARCAEVLDGNVEDEPGPLHDR